MIDSVFCMNKTYNTCIKSIEQITGRKHIDSSLPATKKQKMISRYLDPSRYEFLGFVDRTNNAVLRPRYYNVRDNYGRFAAIEA